MLDESFRALGEIVRERAAARPAHPALVQGETTLSYGALDALMDRVAASLQRDAVLQGQAVALCGAPTPLQAALFLGALRAGVAVAPLAPSVTAQDFASMQGDAQAKLLFVDAGAAALVPRDARSHCIALDAGAPGRSFDAWLAPPGATPQAVHITPDMPFNIIYSSGTTGTPKGIVQPHGMRWMHMVRGSAYGYGPEGVTLLATPLYSNTTLVVFFPTIASGGSVVLMAKFDAARYLALAQQHRATHTMLVPVQYQRIMARPDFGDFDLSSFKLEAQLREHPAVADVSVVGVPSEQWGETPVAFVVRREGDATSADALREWLNVRVGKTQRLADLLCVDELPRSAIGKVLKRELRDRYVAQER